MEFKRNRKVKNRVSNPSRLLFFFSFLLGLVICPCQFAQTSIIQKINIPVQGQFLKTEDLVQRAIDEKLTLPKPEKDGRFQTMNKRGAAIPTANSYIRYFISEVQEGAKRVLQIDATYGHHTVRAVCENQIEYIATDSCVDHLSILAARARNLLPAESLTKLKLFLGRFPEDYSEFEDNSFDTILLNRVVHFYSPEQMTRTLKEAYRILKPGGKIFIIAVTPYVRRFESFIPLYKQRVLLKHSYPGYLKRLNVFANPEVTTPQQMKNLFKGEFMFYDTEVLYRTLSKNRFLVLRCNEFSINIDSKTWNFDGRELVGAIAKKPIPSSIQNRVMSTPADF